MIIEMKVHLNGKMLSDAAVTDQNIILPKKSHLSMFLFYLFFYFFNTEYIIFLENAKLLSLLIHCDNQSHRDSK